MNTTLKSIIGVILLLVSISCIVFSLLAFSHTLSSLTIIVVVSIIIGIASYLPLKRMWDWLLNWRNRAVSILLNIILTVPLSFCLLLLLNSSKIKEKISEKGVVTRLYTKTRHQTKRVGRNHYVQGQPYKVYFMDVEFEDKNSKSIEINHGKYKKVSKGDTLGFVINKGLLGIRFFDINEVSYPQKSTSQKKRESLRQKRHRAYQEHINKVLRHNERN